MLSNRPPAVAGTFYPADPAELAGLVRELLSDANQVDRTAKAVIVPHAGYRYSGAIAAAGFARLATSVKRFVVIGPAHRVAVDGLAWPGAARLDTPVGGFDVDLEALARVPEVTPDPAAHAREHSLEVELPFMTAIAPDAKIVPIVTSRASPEVIGRVLETLWGGPETAIVISSDLSHFHSDQEARRLDDHTAERICAFDPTLSGTDACGCAGINGLSWLARRRRLRIEVAALGNSGDTSGRRDEVVGYGAFALYEQS